MNVLPGRSAEAAYSVWRAPNSALVANRLLPVSQNRVPSGLPVWPLQVGGGIAGVGGLGGQRQPAASRRRCSSLVNSRFASFDWP